MSVPHPEYIDFPGMRTVVVRFRDHPMSEMRHAMDQAFGALGQAIHQGLFVPAGPAFSRHESRPTDTATFETGFPVDEPLSEPITVGEVKIIPSELPACDLATTKHVGPYDGLPQSWQSFMEQLDADGKIPLMPLWEAYETQPGPDVDPQTLVTGLAIPVKDA